MPSELAVVTDLSLQPAAEGITAVEPEAAVPPVMRSSHNLKRPLTLHSIVDQSMSIARGEPLPTPRYHVGQGFAKWISKAVGTTALKEKTEIQDLPAYRLRVGSCRPLPYPPFPSPKPQHSPSKPPLCDHIPCSYICS